MRIGLLRSNHPVSLAEEHLPVIVQLSAALETLRKTVSRVTEEETRRNDHELVAIQDNLHIEPVRMPRPMALSNVKVWAVLEDHTDVANICTEQGDV